MLNFLLGQWVATLQQVSAVTFAFLFVAYIAYLWLSSPKRSGNTFNDDYIRTIKILTQEKIGNGRSKNIARARAKIDTGSDISLVCRKLLSLHNIPFEELSDEDPETSLTDRTKLVLAGKVKLTWYGENHPLSVSRFRFGPRIYSSIFYVPQGLETPFDVIVGRDLINKHRLDQCYCFSGTVGQGAFSSTEKSIDGFTKTQKKIRELTDVAEKVKRLAALVSEAEMMIDKKTEEHNKLEANDGYRPIAKKEIDNWESKEKELTDELKKAKEEQAGSA
ncbi:hypothetical protein EJ08DRAFT_708992 [Tothia fuscella]|uniref:Peptidase A2 domain-containing protein n=1 Tax=Tothia fuscella TaxID=1048955 RepID=A0A9P4U1G1_9PEZI|nr:hypothetical protein EJ08DRAFT_708992 [Tothia fuscella]